MKKSCAMCDEKKPLDAFHENKTGQYGRMSYCKVCKKAYDAAYYRSRAEREDHAELMFHLDADYATDAEVRARFVALAEEARKEGPKRCHCRTRLRLANRKRGVCERCWQKSKSAVMGSIAKVMA